MKVLLSPRAKGTALVGLVGDELKIKVAAPPVEGAANQALLKFLADLLDHSPRAMEVTAGQRGRRKIVKIKDISQDELWRRLDGHLAGG